MAIPGALQRFLGCRERRKGGQIYLMADHHCAVAQCQGRDEARILASSHVAAAAG